MEVADGLADRGKPVDRGGSIQRHPELLGEPFESRSRLR
jgi:hypothetical protein